MKVSVIGTRGSPLAMWQADHVRRALLQAHPRTPLGVKTRWTLRADANRNQAEEYGYFPHRKREFPVTSDNTRQDRLKVAGDYVKTATNQRPACRSLLAPASAIKCSGVK